MWVSFSYCISFLLAFDDDFLFYFPYIFPVVTSRYHSRFALVSDYLWLGFIFF